MTSEVPEDPPLAPDADGEADYDAFVWKNLKRNYAAHFFHGMLGMTGFRVLTAPTFLPAYIFMLSGSSAIVGLAQSLQQAGQIVSPIIGANLVEHRKRVLPAAVLMGTLMRLPILGMALAAWFLEKPAVLWVTIILLALLGLFQGAQRVVFQLLLAKVIPISRRGRLQAYRNITGGVIAAVVSYFAGRYIIEHEVLGNGYATTFLMVFILTSLGLTLLRLLMKEPDPPSLRPRTKLRERLRDFKGLIAGDKDYRNFLIAQALTVAGRMAAPFYILHAGQVVELSGATLGLFTLAFLGADTASNLAWGYLGDKSGFRSNFVAALVISIGAIGVFLFGHSQAMYVLAFAGLGAANAGYMMAAQTLILEFGHRHDVAMRLGISATVEGLLSAVGPLIAGLIAAAAGYPLVFSIAITLQTAALATVLFGVKEPRGRTHP